MSNRLTVDGSAALVQAALEGLGIAYIVDGLVKVSIDDGGLVRLLRIGAHPSRSSTFTTRIATASGMPAHPAQGVPLQGAEGADRRGTAMLIHV